MTIKEAEERTGLTRSNIRFYEKEKLIEPSRNEKNGYRDYSETDIESIKKIAYLRTLDISIEDIRSVISHDVTLTEIIEKQSAALQGQIRDLRKAKSMCDKMLKERDISYEKLEIEKYVTDLHTYWKDFSGILKLDTVGFFHLWGSFMVWAVTACFCFVIGLAAYPQLPDKIPIQWKNEIATSFMDKGFIFSYPFVCVLIRVLIRPVIYMRWFRNNPYGELLTDYLINYMCFILLSVELFSILFVWGFAKNVTAVLLLDTVILIGLLLAAAGKLGLAGNIFAKNKK